MKPGKRTSCLLLAIVFFTGIFGLPSTEPTVESNLAKLDATQDFECPAEWFAASSWCWDSTSLRQRCNSTTYPEQSIPYPVPCRWWEICVGSYVDVPDASAACSPLFGKKHWKYITDKAKGSGILQCITLAPGSATSGTAGDPNDALAVQIEHSDQVEDPPLPDLAQLYYTGATYPIESVTQDEMISHGGSFAFLPPIEPNRPLDLCVNTATQLNMTIGFVSASSTGSFNKRDDVTVHQGVAFFDRVTPDADPNHVSQPEGNARRDVPAGKVWNWVAYETKHALAMQCAMFHSGGVRESAIEIEIGNPANVEYPPMPSVAKLFYHGESDAIETVSRSSMDLVRGTFQFVTPFDTTRALSLCISTAHRLSLSWRIVPKSSTSLDIVNYDPKIVILDRSMDRTADVS